MVHLAIFISLNSLWLRPLTTPFKGWRISNPCSPSKPLSTSLASRFHYLSFTFLNYHTCSQMKSSNIIHITRWKPSILILKSMWRKLKAWNHGKTLPVRDIPSKPSVSWINLVKALFSRFGQEVNLPSRVSAPWPWMLWELCILTVVFNPKIIQPGSLSPDHSPKDSINPITTIDDSDEELASWSPHSNSATSSNMPWHPLFCNAPSFSF